MDSNCQGCCVTFVTNDWNMWLFGDKGPIIGCYYRIYPDVTHGSWAHNTEIALYTMSEMQLLYCPWSVDLTPSLLFIWDTTTVLSLVSGCESCDSFHSTFHYLKKKSK